MGTMLRMETAPTMPHIRGSFAAGIMDCMGVRGKFAFQFARSLELNSSVA
jgi:hypothetical protein